MEPSSRSTGRRGHRSRSGGASLRAATAEAERHDRADEERERAADVDGRQRRYDAGVSRIWRLLMQTQSLLQLMQELLLHIQLPLLLAHPCLLCL